MTVVSVKRMMVTEIKKKKSFFSSHDQLCRSDPSTSEAEQASKHSKQMSSIEKTDDTPMFPKKLPPPLLKQEPPSAESSDADDDDEFVDNSVRTDRSETNQLAKSKHGSKGALHSPIGSTHSFDLQVRFLISSNFCFQKVFCFVFFL